MLITDLVILKEGGNSRAVDLNSPDLSAKSPARDYTMTNGETKPAFAEKLDLHKFSRAKVAKACIELFMVLNNKFYKFTQENKNFPANKKHKDTTGEETIHFKTPEYLWPDVSQITDKHIFSGSSEAFFDSGISDQEFVNHKKSVGDLDLTVPEEHLIPLWFMLKDMENQDITPSFRYVGQQKISASALVDQINAVWEYHDANGSTLLQADFEAAEFLDNKPSDWARFSHSSSWVDTSNSIKGVFHKYLMSAIANASSKVPNGMLVTGSSKVGDAKKVEELTNKALVLQNQLPTIKDKIQQKTIKDQLKALEKEIKDNLQNIKPSLSGGQPKTDLAMHSFSVIRGLRQKVEALRDPDTNQPIILPDFGKAAYKEIQTKDQKPGDFTTKPNEIFEKMFGHYPSEDESKQFRSYIGLLNLLKANVEKHQYLQGIFNYFFTKCWGNTPSGYLTATNDITILPGTGQALERADYTLDKQIKIAAYSRFIAVFPDLKPPEEVMKKVDELYYGDDGLVYKTKRAVGDDELTESTVLKESTDTMLDLSVPSAIKAISDKKGNIIPEKAAAFLNHYYVITEKYDGVKYAAIRRNNEYNPEKPEENWIISYKGRIQYFSEFKDVDNANIKSHSHGISQFKLVWDHIKENHKNCAEIPQGLELLVEFIMKKNTVMSRYDSNHGLFLIAASISKIKQNGDKVITQPIESMDQNKAEYAKMLKLDLPPVIFAGKMGSISEFKAGIQNKNLEHQFNTLIANKRISDPVDLFQFITNCFTGFKSTLGGKPEGVVLSGNGGLFKIQRDDQLNRAARDEVKYAWDDTDPEVEKKFKADISKYADKFYDALREKDWLDKPLEAQLEFLGKFIYSAKIPITHTKRNLHQIQDLIYMAVRTRLLKEQPEANNALCLGKIRIFTRMHEHILKTMDIRYNKVVLCLVTGKDNPVPVDLRERMVKACCPNVEITYSSTGNIKAILNKIPFNITAIFCGSDRKDQYMSQVANMGIKVEEIPRQVGSENDVSTTRCVEALKSNDLEAFKKLTPEGVWPFFKELKAIFAPE